MATTTASAPPSPHDLAAALLQPNPTATDPVAHRAPVFSFTPFLRETHGFGLEPDRPVCKAYQTGHCPNGVTCRERHVLLPTEGEGEEGKEGTSERDRRKGRDADGQHQFYSLVCKHWLRALCKKGASCEFLHEYNLRRMPECNFYLRYGYCANLDECLYLHIDPAKKLPPCPWYEQGFCPNGPNCARRHVRRAIICPFYLAGFCPDGRLKCQRGAHPKWKVLEGRPPVKGEETETAAAGTTADGAAADTKGEQGSHEAGHPLEGEDGGPPIRRPPDAGHGTGWGRDRDRDRDDAEGHRRGDRDRDHRGGRGGPGKWRGGKKKAMWRQNHG